MYWSKQRTSPFFLVRLAVAVKLAEMLLVAFWVAGGRVGEGAEEGDGGSSWTMALEPARLSFEMQLMIQLMVQLLVPRLYLKCGVSHA